ncbi:hypothetical protein CR201_G0048414 [Pongo abelii]|uniref:Uncharacterized protein n=1 Tax=Pongo abelii TaxID=9601 RepID=A0A2J8RVS9_PONAB|nr:hypothetical protein CR201_G0048414 [Pongo abelii]
MEMKPLLRMETHPRKDATARAAPAGLGGRPPPRGPGLRGAETAVQGPEQGELQAGLLRGARGAETGEPAAGWGRAPTAALGLDLLPAPEVLACRSRVRRGEWDELKSSTGSAPILVVMVILLNIGVAILFINFFI